MRRALQTLRVAIALAAVAGCSGRGLPLQPLLTVRRPPAAVAHSPADVVTILRAAWTRRDTSAYAGLFTGDYEFIYSSLEATDNTPLRRLDELVVARNLFVGGTAYQPAVRSIELTYGALLVPVADPRPGRTDAVHQAITIPVTLKADLGDAIWYVQGDQRFYVVRGDSANVPEGLPRDSTRWYLERWEEYSTASGTLAARAGRLDTQPTNRHTWSQLKSLYR